MPIWEGDTIYSIEKKKCLPVLLWALMGLLLIPAGCGRGRQDNGDRGEIQDETTEIQDEEPVTDDQLYILLYSNTDTGRIFVESVETGRQEEFEYNGGTYIYDRYGKSVTMERLTSGELIHISYTDSKVLTEIQTATETFVYDTVTRFRIDNEKDMITIAGSNYYYDEAMIVFSENGIISLNELSNKDVLCFRGMDKKILTVSVTRGHGTVALKNTDVFQGGMVTIGNVAATEITGDMVLEVPEGTHILSVANDGYGGTMKITVNRFEEVSVDLNALKGEEPSYCMLTLSVVQENAKVFIDGVLTDYEKPIQLKYGAYQLTIEAKGQEDWSGKLVVNSPEADIKIDMEEDADDNSSDQEEDKDKSEDEEEDKDKPQDEEEDKDNSTDEDKQEDEP